MDHDNVNSLDGRSDKLVDPRAAAHRRGQLTQLRRVANDLRLLALVFAVLGLLMIALVMQSRGNPGTSAVSSVTGIALIGPSFWYFYAAGLIRKLRAWAVPFSLKVAAGQAGVVVLCLIAAPLVTGGTRNILIPALLTTFFLPALGAMAWKLWKSLDLIRAIEPTGVAFEVSHVTGQQPAHTDGEIPFARVAHPPDATDIPFAKRASETSKPAGQRETHQPIDSDLPK